MGALYVRRITESNLFPCCQSCAEDSFYALVDCWVAKSTCDTHPDGGMQHEEATFAAWWERMMPSKSVEQAHVSRVQKIS